MFGFVLEQTQHVLLCSILLKYIFSDFYQKEKIDFWKKPNDLHQVPSETSIIGNILLQVHKIY